MTAPFMNSKGPTAIGQALTQMRPPAVTTPPDALNVQAPELQTAKRFVVDRIEGDMAVLETPQGMLDIPAMQLPPDASAGSVVMQMPDGSFQTDPEDTMGQTGHMMTQRSVKQQFPSTAVQNTPLSKAAKEFMLPR